MLDRVWRAALLLLSCQTTLAKIHRMMFPHNPQPQDITAPANQFRDGKAVKKMFHAQLVVAANIAMAYLRKHRPQLPIHRVMSSLPNEQHYTESLAPARWMVRQVQYQSERLVGPLEDPKGEPTELD